MRGETSTAAAASSVPNAADSHSERTRTTRNPGSRDSGTPLCAREVSLRARTGLGRAPKFPDSYFANEARVAHLGTGLALPQAITRTRSRRDALVWTGRLCMISTVTERFQQLALRVLSHNMFAVFFRRGVGATGRLRCVSCSSGILFELSPM